jgi:hypothetical protein
MTIRLENGWLFKALKPYPSFVPSMPDFGGLCLVDRPPGADDDDDDGVEKDDSIEDHGGYEEAVDWVEDGAAAFAGLPGDGRKVGRGHARQPALGNQNDGNRGNDNR